MNWLFKPGTPDEVIEDIYIHTLTLAISAAIQRTRKARVIWPQDDEIAARVMTARGAAKGRRPVTAGLRVITTDPWQHIGADAPSAPRAQSRLCASDSTPGVPCREVPDRRLEACAGRPRRVPSRRDCRAGAAGTVSKDPRTDQVDDLGRRSRERPQQGEIG